LESFVDDVNSPSKWAADYERGTDGWDLGGPTPTFRHLLAGARLAPGRLIVLGAGRGHDAREFARHGFEVTAVDFTPFAVAEMRRLAALEAPVTILQHDIFDLPGSLDGGFDYLLEYTCFCAIDPRCRAEYADLVARLLRPGGMYIDLAFPLSAHSGGPPFAVSTAEMLDLFGARSFRLISREPPTGSAPRRAGIEELLIFQKA
jgi:SAM-dependent methyltransferase